MSESQPGERQLQNSATRLRLSMEANRSGQETTRRGKERGANCGPWKYEKMGSHIWKPRICLKWSCNTKLQVYENMYFI